MTWEQLHIEVKAKSNGESLVKHTEKTLAIIGQFENRLTDIPNITELYDPFTIARKACWLHDLGKGAEGFQKMLETSEGWGGKRHEVLSLAFFDWLNIQDEHIKSLLVGTVVSHHKDQKRILELYSPDYAEDLCLEEFVAELPPIVINQYYQWYLYFLKQEFGMCLQKQEIERDFFQKAPNEIVKNLRLFKRFVFSLNKKGSRSINNKQALVLRGMMRLADYMASANAPNIEILDLPNLKAMGEILKITRWHKHQEEATKRMGNQLLIAPTGSGKTETSLLWVERRRDINGRLSGQLVYILPYQASLNAMYKRLKELVSLEVGLLHGRSIQTLFRELLDEGVKSQEAERIAKRKKDLAKLFQPAIWVTTPYQILRAAYRLPGYENIWTALSGAKLVIDEIHAYDPKRLGMFIALLEELAINWQAKLFVMSATIPTWLKIFLVEKLTLNIITADDKLVENFRRHRLQLIDREMTDLETLEFIKKLYHERKSVLIVVNTVKKAQIIWNKCREFVDEEDLVLYHSRFNMRDRLNVEQRIIEEMDAKKEQAKPLIVVATQTVEVSLNLDFDTIVTEPAPLEAIIQRLGRVNRKGQKGIVDVHLLLRPVDGQGVYNDQIIKNVILCLTLPGRQGVILDDRTLSLWLDEIYMGELDFQMLRELEMSYELFKKNCLDTLIAYQSDENLKETFDQLFDGIEVLPYSLAVEFEQLAEESIIEAHSLLVPISYSGTINSYVSLAKCGLAYFDKKLKAHIVNLPYDEKLGLSFNPKQPG